MTNFARIINNVAVDVSSNPAEQFHPSIAVQFEPVPDEVQAGWIRTGDKWAAPDPVVTEPQPEAPTVTPVEFMLLFTSSERIAIKAARETDAIVDDFFGIVDDPRLTEINLGSNGTKGVIEHLVAVSLITEARKSEILSGVAQ